MLLTGKKHNQDITCKQPSISETKAMQMQLFMIQCFKIFDHIHYSSNFPRPKKADAICAVALANNEYQF
jgi:hypothetical protein